MLRFAGFRNGWNININIHININIDININTNIYLYIYIYTCTFMPTCIPPATVLFLFCQAEDPEESPIPLD